MSAAERSGRRSGSRSADQVGIGPAPPKGQHSGLQRAVVLGPIGPDQAALKDDPGKPAAKDQRVNGAGQIHAQQENEMGKTIDQRPANDDQPGLLQFGRPEAKDGDGRPAKQKAEADCRHAKEDSHSWFLTKGGQISALGYRLADKGGGGTVANQFSG